MSAGTKTYTSRRAIESGARYHVRMSMRAALLLLIPSLASADTFGGFSGVDRPYLVNQDKVCAPLEVKSAAATGAPKCEKATADIIARLSFKDPIIQSGTKAAFGATASG